MRWNIFSSFNTCYFIPVCCPTLGSFIYNEDHKSEIRAIQPVGEVVYFWLTFRVIAKINQDIYWNETKKKA